MLTMANPTLLMCVLQVTSESGNILKKNTILQENWVQNPEGLAFCEDISK